MMFTNSDIEVANEKWINKKRMSFGKNRIDIVQYIKDFSPAFGAINVLSKDNSFKMVNERTGMSVDVSFDAPVLPLVQAESFLSRT